MLRIARLTLLAGLLLVAATPLYAAIYKWVDDNGVTHYTQQPPPGGDAIQINPAVPPSSDQGTDNAGSDAAAQGQDGTSPDDTNSESSSEDDSNRTMEAYCKELRNQAQLLASDRSVREKQSDGTLVKLEGKAREQRLAELRGQIEQHCSE